MSINSSSINKRFLLQKNIIENFFEREVSRLKFVEERRKIRAMETAKNKENEKPKEKAQVYMVNCA